MPQVLMKSKQDSAKPGVLAKDISIHEFEDLLSGDTASGHLAHPASNLQSHLAPRGMGCPTAARPLSIESTVVVACSGKQLFSQVKRFLEDDIPTDIVMSDETELTLEATVIQDFSPLDVSVRVVPADGKGSQAIWAHKSRSDTVRFNGVVQRAKQVLIPGCWADLGMNSRSLGSPWSSESFCEFELDDDDFSEDDWSSTIEALLTQACSPQVAERQEAASALASHALTCETFRAPLAEAIIKRRDVIQNLFIKEATFGMQYAAAAALAHMSKGGHLEAGAIRGARSVISELLRADGLPVPVQRELLRAKRGLETTS
jgi:hypothetical protein